MASVEDLMSAAEMKPIFAIAKREPVPVALGLTGDKSAAIFVAKRGAPKKARAQMRAEAKKLKLEIESGTIRFGVAVIDEQDEALLLFRVNKAPAPALVVKVRERMRKAAWSKIEFVVDESLDAVPDEDGEGAAATTPSETEAVAESVTTAPHEEVGSPVVEPTAPDAGAAIYAKSRLAWLAAREKVESDLAKLKAEIMETFKDDGLTGEIDTAYRAKVEPVMHTLDESLAAALDEAVKAADAEVRAEHVAEARAIMGRYAQFLGSSQIITELDSNPFMAMAIKATIGGTLGALSKVVR